MSTQPQERYWRVCPTHNVEVEDHGSSLICPRGQHVVTHFRVLDRLKRTSVEVAVDGDDMRGGLVEEGTKLTRPRPAPAGGRGLHGDKPKEVLAKAKFGDAAGGVLWIRLLRLVTKTKGPVFVVRWARHDHGQKVPAETAPLAIETSTETGRAVYAAAVAQALRDGWREVPMLRREINIRPLPKPAAAKGKR